MTLPVNPLRVLLVQSSGRNVTPREVRRQRQLNGLEPRSLYLADHLKADILDEESLGGSSGVRVRVYRWLPAFVAQAIEARRRSGDYDVVLSWSEKHSIAIAAVFSFARPSARHVAMTSLISKPSVRVPFRYLRRGISGIITWSSVQRSVAITLGYRPEDVVYVPHPVDTAFFRPMASERTTIFSAGSTMRDYETLVEAARHLDVPVRVAASWVVILGGLRARVTDVRKTLRRPENFEVTQLEAPDLRAAYAQSRVVVVPLIPSDMDNGVNVILEGMSMGRPVIASRTPGQVDVIEDGVTGFLVTPSSPIELRKTISKLLKDEQAAQEVGERACAYVRRVHTVEGFALNVERELQHFCRTHSD